MSKRKAPSPVLTAIARLDAAQVQLERGVGFVQIAQDDEAAADYISILRFVESSIQRIVGEIHATRGTLDRVQNLIEAMRT